MIKLSYDEIKEREVNILNYIKDVCNKNNLKYYLYSGTLAGAVKYNDFLPNDDDIDIVLSRPDYERLLVILKKCKKYKLLTPYNNSNYYYPFAKLVDKKTSLREKSRLKISDLGIYVDIFPMDGLPKYFKKTYLFKMRVYKKLLLTKMLSKPEVKSIKHIYFLLKYYMFMFINYLFRNRKDNYFALLIDKKSKKYKYDSSKYISLVCYGSRNNNYILKSDFEKQSEYLFCGNYYTSIEDSSMLLDRIYGKKINNCNNRKHNFIAFLK